MAGGLAGHVLDERATAVASALLVDVRPKPVQQGREVAHGEAVLQVGEGFQGGVEKLGGVKGAQGVGGEIAEAAEGPMHILEAAQAVIGHFQTHVLLEDLVPGCGDVAHGQIAADDRLLDLEAQHDVQVVGDLVCFHPDERWADGIDRKVKVLQRNIPQ